MYNLFILGAGFSKPAGLPLGTELFAEVLRLAKLDTSYQNIIRPDVERYIRYIERTEGATLSEQAIDFERFTSFLDVEHFLRLTGSDTYTEQGNRTQMLVRNFIARILYHRQRRMPQAARDLYDYFASKLRPNDIVVTFNYDTIVEESLERAKIPYRLFPQRYTEVHAGYGTVDIETEEVILLKMHGSIDWFDKQPYVDSIRYHRSVGAPGIPRDAVFNNPAIRPEPLVGGPYFDTSRLLAVHRVRNLEQYFADALFPIEAPLIVSPSYSKIVYLSPIVELWNGFNGFGVGNGTVAIVGYSLPSHDEYIQQVIYSIFRNFQHVDLGEYLQKTLLRFVDRRETEAEQAAYRGTYRFADWARSEAYFGGFDRRAVDMLFAA
jgi:hypothetical protein